jgi:hypothetical protein
VASVFATLRVTGHVSNDVAREIEAAVQAMRDAGLEVRGGVDVWLDPEPVAVGVDLASSEDVTVIVETPVVETSAE